MDTAIHRESCDAVFGKEKAGETGPKKIFKKIFKISQKYRKKISRALMNEKNGQVRKFTLFIYASIFTGWHCKGTQS
jgi:hypothetical protein